MLVLSLRCSLLAARGYRLAFRLKPQVDPFANLPGDRKFFLLSNAFERRDTLRIDFETADRGLLFGRVMTAKEALDAAKAVDLRKRVDGYWTVCVPRGGCHYEPLANELGGMRWTWCPDCLTVYDDYRKAINPLELTNGKPH
jgi:hypothetical protein